MNAPDVVEAAAGLTILLMSVAALVTFYRLARGPGLADRVVALDLIATAVAGIAAVFTVLTGDAVYLRITIVVTLIAFLGTIAFAYFLEKGGAP